MSDQPEYVGFWIRFIAFLIDSVAAMILLGVVGSLLLGPSPAIDPVAIMEDPTATLTRASFEVVVAAVIFVGCWTYLFSTPGKMIFNAYIVDARTLRPTTTGKLVIRYIGYYASVLLLMLGFIWIAFDKRKQGLHDKLAGTVVIKGKPAETTGDADA